LLRAPPTKRVIPTAPFKLSTDLAAPALSGAPELRAIDIDKIHASTRWNRPGEVIYGVLLTAAE
jgi:hypothetical protein